MAYIYEGQFGSYQVVQSSLGEGSYCTVDVVTGTCAQDLANRGIPKERRYAAKVLSKEKLERIAKEKRDLVWTNFRDEILSLHEIYMTDLRHRHIIAVVDYGIPDHYSLGHCFGITELASGDLAGQIEYERRSLLGRTVGWLSGHENYRPLDKLTQCKGLAEALATIHGMEIVHRDIKPANLLFVDGVLKVADLGLAAEVGGHSVARAGTPRYAPPEFYQRFYEGSVHPGSDVFSWAVVLYEWLAGHYPFEALDFDTSISRLQQKIYSPLDRVAIRGMAKEFRQALDDEIFSTCFSPTPEMRPTAAEVAETIASLLERFAA